MSEDASPPDAETSMSPTPSGHRAHRRSLVALTILGLVLAGVGGAVVVRQQQNDPAPPPSPSTSSPSPTMAPDEQPTLLVQVRDDRLRTINNVLVGADAASGTSGTSARQVGANSDAASQVFLPSTLLVDVSSEGPVPLAATGTVQLEEGGRLVGDLLGTWVDGVFVMDRLAFAGLIDSVDGVVVRIKAPLKSVRADGKPIVVKPGVRRLDGPTAADYCLGATKGEPESARTARFEVVWNKVLKRLPSDQLRIRAILGSLGALARTSVPADDVASILASLHVANAERALTSAVLPTTSLKPIKGRRPLEVQQLSASVAVMRARFPESTMVVGVGGARARVRVLQAGASNEELATVKDELEGADFVFVPQGPAEPQERSTILVGTSGSGRVVGLGVAQTVGLRPSAVREGAAEALGVEAALVAGKDAGAAAAQGTRSASADGGQ